MLEGKVPVLQLDEHVCYRLFLIWFPDIFQREQVHSPNHHQGGLCCQLLFYQNTSPVELLSLHRFHNFLRGIVEIIRSDHVQAALIDDLFTSFDIRALETDDKRHV